MGRAVARAQARTRRGAPALGTCCTVLAQHLLANTRVLHSVVRGVSKLLWANSLVLILLCLQSKGYKSSLLSLAGVAEAGSSLAVLPLRLRLYPCCSHHRNRDASELEPAPPVRRERGAQHRDRLWVPNHRAAAGRARGACPSPAGCELPRLLLGEQAESANAHRLRACRAGCRRYFCECCKAEPAIPSAYANSE